MRINKQTNKKLKIGFVLINYIVQLGEPLLSIHEVKDQFQKNKKIFPEFLQQFSYSQYLVIPVKFIKYFDIIFNIRYVN